MTVASGPDPGAGVVRQPGRRPGMGGAAEG